MSETKQSLYRQLETMRAERDAMAARCDQLQQAYDVLLGQVKQLLRDRFGRRSERYEDAHSAQQLLFDTPSISDADTGTLPAGTDGNDTDNVVHIAPYRRRKRRNLRFPDELPRRDVIVPIDEASRVCDCGQSKVIIRYASHERLFYQPPVYEVIVERREIAACPKGCQGQMVTAPKPPHILPKSKLGESLLAHLIVSKLDDRQPLYHLERQLKNRAGISLSRQSMARAIIDCAAPLVPLVNLLKDRIIEYDIAALDATTLQVLKEPGRRPTTKSYVYCMRGGPPEQAAEIYLYNAQAHKQFVDEWFEGFAGVVHCDADAFFDRLFARASVHPSYCNAHARRKFEPVAKASQTPGLAHQAMTFYRELYAIERRAKDDAMTPPQRYALRQQYTRPLMQQFKTWLDAHQPTVVRKSALGLAFNYTIKHWQGLTAFLNDGRLEPDNNLTEQAIKPLVIARRNFMFCDTVAGAKALCVHFSLIRTAKVHGLDPFRYYARILSDIPHCQGVDDFEALLPWNITRAPAAHLAEAA